MDAHSPLVNEEGSPISQPLRWTGIEHSLGLFGAWTMLRALPWGMIIGGIAQELEPRPS